MPKDADLLAFGDHGLVDRLRDHQRRDRQKSGRERLCHGDHVGLELERLRAPHVCGAVEPADDLVDDEQEVVFLEDRLDFVEIGRRRNDHAAGTHDRLGDEGGDRLGILAQDQLLEILGEPGRKRLLAFARMGEAVMMRAVGVDDAGDRQIEIALVCGKAGQACRGDGDAVIGFHPRNDLLLLRPAERVVVVPDQLHRRVVRLRAGVGEEHLRHRHWGKR